MGSLPFLSFCGLTGLPLLLLQIVPKLLIREEVVDVLHKQMAVQMLDLVAEGSGRQALPLQQLEVAQDGGEWGAQVVGDVGDLLPDGLLLPAV